MGTHMEGPSATQTNFDNLAREYQQALPGESIYLFDNKNRIRYFIENTTFKVDENLMMEIRKNKNSLIEKGERLIFGTPIVFSKGDFYLVASALDIVGANKLRYMARTMVISFLIFLVFSVLAGQLLAKNALKPIQSVISQVNS